jgi:hypothetical protein
MGTATVLAMCVTRVRPIRPMTPTVTVYVQMWTTAPAMPTRIRRMAMETVLVMYVILRPVAMDAVAMLTVVAPAGVFYRHFDRLITL